MAARTNRPYHTDETREKIRVSQLLNRLQDHVFVEEGKKPVEISPTQMKAIEILLRKSLPDLSSTELTGLDGGPIKHEHSVKPEDREIIDRYLQERK